ncbi:MAG: cobalamin-binding protein [Desulfobulbaceae bacterium]|uniref:Cobalamin-binding protein n=1 Tax=Candidatus Desulfatifera sulfidica TaxID=2841691 RepID=A0A8J6N9E3_9BACT|nr:cobalamin-binding protein [Candidatus Desulfatifera sulfidica]
MIKRILFFLCLLAVFFPCTLVLSASREMIDPIGRNLIVPASPARVVSLAPSLTELVYSLGREELLVGATLYSTFPEAARALPRVGSYVRLDLERIVALKPDLCLAVKDGNPRHVIERIESLGIPVFVVDPISIDEIMTTIVALGDLLGACPAAEALAADMAARIDAVGAQVAEAAHRPALFFQVDAAPLISAGEDTFTGRLIRMAGGENLAAGGIPYPRYNWEDILRLAPEVVVITSMAGGHNPEDLIAEWQKWPQIPAVRSGRIHVVEADFFNRPTERLVQGLEVLAALIHPELFADESGHQLIIGGDLP